VQYAHTGPDGLSIAQQWQPDIALLDIGLPGLDGYELARRLRASEALPAKVHGQTRRAGGPARMILISVTGYGRDEDIIRAREAGFDGHMVKPCDFNKLEDMMAAPSFSI
jgi:CheY-like chemotaxis protein